MVVLWLLEPGDAIFTRIWWYYGYENLAVLFLLEHYAFMFTRTWWCYAF